MRKNPQQTRSMEMVERILDGAGTVLQKHGIDGFGTRQIANETGISVGSLYQYFGHKREILDALQGRLTQRLMTMLRQQLPALVGYDIEEAVRVILNGACDVLDENDGRYLALVRNWQRADMRQSIQRIESMIFTTVGVLASSQPELRQLGNLPLALYIGINSAIFNIVRYSSGPNPYFSRAELIDGLARMFASYVREQTSDQENGDSRIGRRQ